MGNLLERPSIDWLPEPDVSLRRALELKGLSFSKVEGSQMLRVQCPVGWGFLTVAVPMCERSPVDQALYGWLVDPYYRVAAAVMHDNNGKLVTQACRPYIIDKEHWTLVDGNYVPIQP